MSRRGGHAEEGGGWAAARLAASRHKRVRVVERLDREHVDVGRIFKNVRHFLWRFENAPGFYPRLEIGVKGGDGVVAGEVCKSSFPSSTFGNLGRPIRVDVEFVVVYNDAVPEAFVLFRVGPEIGKRSPSVGRVVDVGFVYGKRYCRGADVIKNIRVCVYTARRNIVFTLSIGPVGRQPRGHLRITVQIDSCWKNCMLKMVLVRLSVRPTRCVVGKTASNCTAPPSINHAGVCAPRSV